MTHKPQCSVQLRVKKNIWTVFSNWNSLRDYSYKYFWNRWKGILASCAAVTWTTVIFELGRQKNFMNVFPWVPITNASLVVNQALAQQFIHWTRFFCKPNAILNKRTQDLERWRGACWVGEQGHVTSEGDFSSLVVPKIKLSTKGADAVSCGSLPHHRRWDSNSGCSLYKRCGLSGAIYRSSQVFY